VSGTTGAGRAAIIIFGAALWPGGVPSPALARRVEAALRFGATQENPLYLPTGGIGRHGPAEARVMAAILARAGVPASAILIEDTARDTTDSVLACRRLLRNWPGPVFAATCDYHLPRCLLLLRLAGIRAQACPPPPPTERAGLRAWQIGREALALPYDTGLMLWWRMRGRLAD